MSKLRPGLSPSEPSADGDAILEELHADRSCTFPAPTQTKAITGRTAAGGDRPPTECPQRSIGSTGLTLALKAVGSWFSRSELVLQMSQGLLKLRAPSPAAGRTPRSSWRRQAVKPIMTTLISFGEENWRGWQLEERGGRPTTCTRLRLVGPAAPQRQLARNIRQVRRLFRSLRPRHACRCGWHFDSLSGPARQLPPQAGLLRRLQTGWLASTLFGLCVTQTATNRPYRSPATVAGV